MKYFTRRFINGAMSEGRMKQAIAAYSEHLADLGLSPALEFLGRLNLHDAHILAVTLNNAAGSLRLLTRHGDLQTGYADTMLNFSGITINANSVEILRKAIRPANAGILATELDAAKACYQLRILLWPKGEAAISFGKVVLKSKAVSSRRATRYSFSRYLRRRNRADTIYTASGQD